MKTIPIILGSFCLYLSSTLAMADIDIEINQLQTRWANVNYEMEGDYQVDAFEVLATDADRVTQAYPAQASAWIWSGIIKSTYAGAKGGLGALGLAKQAKRDLEQAMELDADALDGSAYASLGTLYYSVPGWPIGFGNDDKAEELLLQALLVNPDAIDNNYFYATYLLEKRRYDEAEKFLIRAQLAAPRPQRPLADAGRREEIRLALAELQQKL